VQFPLPSVAAADVVEVQLNFRVSDSGGGGVAVVLHGLGPRAVRHGRYPLAAADFYEPEADPLPPGHVLIAEEFVAAGLPANITVSLRSPALRDYVRAQLDLPGSPGYTALRLSPSEYHGCKAHCDSRCQQKRYHFVTSTLSLAIAVNDGPLLLYKPSGSPGLDAGTLKEEFDTIEDKIVGLDNVDATQEEGVLKEIEEELVEEVVAEELEVINEETEELELKDSSDTQEKEEEVDKLVQELTKEEAKVTVGEEKAFNIFDTIEEVKEQVLAGKDTGDTEKEGNGQLQDKGSDELQEAKDQIAQLKSELEDFTNKPQDKGSDELQETKDELAQLQSELEDLRNNVPSPSANGALSSGGDMEPGFVGSKMSNLLGVKGNTDITISKSWVAIPVVLLLVLVAYRKFRRGGGRERIMQSDNENAFTDYIGDIHLKEEEQQDDTILVLAMKMEMGHI